MALLPSAVAVIVLTPGFLPVTIPFSSIVATLIWLLFQVTGELLEVVADSLKLSPRSIDMEALLIETSVFFTVTLHEASPLLTLAVIVAVPAFVTLPQELTEAIRESTLCPFWYLTVRWLWQ